MVFFKSSIFRFAQDDISAAGAGAAAAAGATFGLGLRVSCSPSGSGEVAAGAEAGCSSGAFPVGEGASAVHEARNTAARRYLMTSSLGATGR